MNRILRYTAPFFVTIMVVASFHCSKKKDAASTCRVCKVAGTGVDQQVIQQQVCSDSEEKAFRDANAGKTVTCN